MTGGMDRDGEIDFDRVCTADALTVLHDAILHNQAFSTDPNIKAILKLISMRFSTMNEIIRNQSREIARLKGTSKPSDGGRDAEPETKRPEG